jgi:L-amino acid N-acyltransferase YncA
MKFLFHPEALAEAEDATRYYEAQCKGLGDRFNEEVENRLAIILADPLRWRSRPDGARRVNLEIFPYYMSYVIRGDLVWILTVSHGHREPGHWKSRLADTPR